MHDEAVRERSSEGQPDGGAGVGWARASLAFAVGAPTAYVLVRLFERARDGGGDPGLIVKTAHTGFVWRVVVAVWCGVLVALAAERVGARRDAPTKTGAATSPRPMRLVLLAVALCIAGSSLVALLWP